jgi:regulator of sirC expression with transglutaminase-like and TPR domain
MKRNKLTSGKIRALISLLDDPDARVYDSVKTEILNSGFDMIPELQSAYRTAEDALQSERLAEILDKVKLQKLTLDIEHWREDEQPDLLEGMLHIARYGYPDLDTNAITGIVDEMVRSVASKIAGKTPREVIGIFNRVILHDFGFGGSFTQYSALNNSFVNKIFETRMSNPIGLSVLYLLVAQKTGVPLMGINSPGHFILAYAATDTDAATDRIAFFIDPFHSGKIMKSEQFKAWLKSQPTPHKALDTLMATEKTIIKRVFNNLIHALYTTGEKITAEKLLAIAESI